MAATGGAKQLSQPLSLTFVSLLQKLFGFFITSSSAMLAESIHSFAIPVTRRCSFGP